MDPETQKKIDSLILETTAKMEAIVMELENIKQSELDDVSKREKSDFLRKEFEEIMLEQQRRVEIIKKFFLDLYIQVADTTQSPLAALS